MKGSKKHEIDCLLLNLYLVWVMSNLELDILILSTVLQ